MKTTKRSIEHPMKSCSSLTKDHVYLNRKEICFLPWQISTHKIKNNELENPFITILNDNKLYYSKILQSGGTQTKLLFYQPS